MATKRLSGDITIDDEQSEQSEMDPFKQDNKYGSVLQKDLDKITGGMQTVQEFNMDLNKLEKLVGTPPNGTRPTQGKIDFICDQLEQNEFFKEFVNTWDKKIEKIIDNQAAIQKYNYKGKIKDTMLEMSPVRKAKVEIVNRKHQNQQKPIIQNKNIMLMEVDLNDSFDQQTLLQQQPTAVKKFKTNQAKDQFSHSNKKKMDKNSLERQERHDRMKQYGRWLLYAGVDHLPADKKLAHKVPGKEKVQHKFDDSELESPLPRVFGEAIEEQNEGSKATTSLSEDMTSNLDKTTN